MSRVPIRLRVAAAFAVAMAVVLAATGLFVYARLADDLAGALDQDLRLRGQDLSALVREPDRTLAAEPHGRLIERGESFAQLLDQRGRVLDTTRSLGNRPLLLAAQLGAALPRDRFFDRRSVPGLDERARLLAVTVDHAGRRDVLVVGATLENRAEALRSLRTELLIAAPVALVLATMLGYLLAGAGLRAVEAMRRRAAEISAERADERLPVPRTGDELQQLGETLNAMLTRLDRALERERGFVAEAGHELRTPLALLRAELDYALRYADSEEELRAALQSASQETDRLVQLASDLLLIASSDKGQLPLRLERLSAREVIESVRRRFVWRAEAEGRALMLGAPDSLTVDGDRIRLEQALGNLLDNALRHGGGTVTLKALSADGAVELAVHDEGPGFPPEFLARAFQRFSRADNSRSGAGAGLGLAIVETIARAHQGRATAVNRSDGGAVVAIRLPASGASERRSPASAGADQARPPVLTDEQRPRSGQRSAGRGIG
jgi:two-component system, OmpR family, sensor kinase